MMSATSQIEWLQGPLRHCSIFGRVRSCVPAATMVDDGRFNFTLLKQKMFLATWCNFGDNLSNKLYKL